jgi:threonine dehydratase
MQSFVPVGSSTAVSDVGRPAHVLCRRAPLRHRAHVARGHVSRSSTAGAAGTPRAAVSSPAAARPPVPDDAAASHPPPSSPPVDYLERVLTSRVYEVVDETPLQHAPLLSRRIENRVLLKREDTTIVNSFKVRGAFNMMAMANPEKLRNGVVAASAGNHAQGVALAAQVLGVPATIVMPQVTPKIKVDAVKLRGAETVLHGDTFDQAKAKALELADQGARLFVPPFDHPDIIAGQGTVGLELIRQCPHMDVVFVPVGGGGLIAGIAAVIKRLRPATRIVGVEPRDADALFQSLAAGKRVRLSTVGTFADGVAVIEVGEETFRLCRDLVDEVILVDTDEICAAIKDIFEETRSILEPAGALSVAGAKSYAAREGIRDQTLVTILSGANMNFDRLRHVSERAEIGEGREAIFAVTVPEQPGAFRDLIASIGPEVNISEFNYRHAGPGMAHVFVGASLSRRREADLIRLNLEVAGYPVLDMTDNELAKLHLRHLVGGNTPVACTEMVFRFEFPERPGALRRFLFDLPSGWNITLFHYRNHGTDVGRVLVGLDTSENCLENIDTFIARVGYKAVREDDNPAYKFFLGGRS